MKPLQITLFFLLFFSFSFSIFGQHAIIYDYSKGDFRKAISPVPEGEFVTFKIINVNTFRFKVEIEGINIDFVTQVPSELQTLFRLPDESANNATTTDGLKESKEATDHMKNLLDIASTNTKEAAVADKPKKQKLEKALEDLTQACDEYIIIAQKVANIKFIRVELINLSKHDWEDYKKLAARLQSTPLQSRSSMKKDYDDFITAYAKAYSLYTKAKNAAKAAGDTDKQEEIEEAEEKLEEANKKINADNFLKLIEDVMVLQEALQNDKYFEVKSAPIQMDGDFMEFTVKITPVQTNDL